MTEGDESRGSGGAAAGAASGGGGSSSGAGGGSGSSGAMLGTKGERAKATGDLDRVTDYVEERELDSAAVTDSMRAVIGNAAAAKRKVAAAERDGGITVKISQNDVQIIVDELEIEHRVAERALRKARGDVVEALCELVR